MTTGSTGFDEAVEGYRKALDAFVKGDPQPALEYVSRRDDVTLANPLGPPQRGPAAVDRTASLAATQISDGFMDHIEEVSRYSTADLGYVVEIERCRARVGGSADLVPMTLRATMIFRREGDTWKLAHRHADTITTARPTSSMIET